MDKKGRSRMKRSRTLIVTVLMVIALIVFSAAPALAQPVGPYDVSFVTMRYDYPTPGHSTWYYTVTSSGDANAISHLVFELGACCNVTDAGLWVDFSTLVSWWGTSKIDVTEDPTTGVFGIKFDDGFAEGETRNYYFTVEGNHALADGQITVAIKTGGGSALLMNGASLFASVSGVLSRVLGLASGGFTTYEASIYGPALDCEHTTAVTLNNFSAASPSGSSGPLLLIPAALLGMAVLLPGAVVLAGRLRRQEM
jgi:hypothetical protein